MQKAHASVVVILVEKLYCKIFWGFKGPDVAFKTDSEPEAPLQRGTHKNREGCAIRGVSQVRQSAGFFSTKPP